MSQVHLLTVNQINFTKGIVVKKHLIERKKGSGHGDASKMSDDDDSGEEIMKQTGSESSVVKKRRLKRRSTYLQYEIMFMNVNPKNLTQEAMGGLDPNTIPWTIQLETVSNQSYNMMRQCLQTLCSSDKLSRHRKLLVHEDEPKWESDDKFIKF